MNLRKRKFHQILITDDKKMLIYNKKRKCNNIASFAINDKYNIDNTWVSASSTSNFLLNDPVLDYMKLNDKHNNNYIQHANDSNYTDITDILKKQGIYFEEAVIKFILSDKINNKYRDFITISKNYKDVLNIKYYHKTLDSMERGIPLIYQGVLHDVENKIYGSPDLLVRSDYINCITNNIIMPDPPNRKRYYYVVIDIKSSILHLRADGIHLLNYGRMNAHKGQIYIYHKILSKIQQFDSNIAFVLGRGYKFECRGMNYNGNGWFDRLGKINFQYTDKHIIKKVNKAVRWRKNVQRNFKKMKLLPKPTHPYLYPNMCNKYDNSYKKRKRELAEALGEHTLIGCVSVANRIEAHKKRVYRFDDVKCNIDVLKVTGNKRRKIINLLLDMNKQNTEQLFTPKKIESNMFDWRNTKKSIEAYVDFETIPNLTLENYNIKLRPETIKKGQFIFLIGIYFKDKYHTFIADKMNSYSEKKILIQFTKFVKDNKITKLYHWGKSAEPYMYSNSYNGNKMNNIYKLPTNIWCDMYTLFRELGIGVKGARSYGLKDIGKAMYENKLINYTWDKTTNLGNTMVTAWSINKNLSKNNYSKLTDDVRMNDIINYNKVDCKILKIILQYMRDNC